MCLLRSKLKHEIIGKAFPITFYRLIQNLRSNAIQGTEIGIEQHFLTAKAADRLHHTTSGDDFLFMGAQPSGKQSRHLNDGCVEDVEDELRRDADGKHEQRNG